MACVCGWNDMKRDIFVDELKIKDLKLNSFYIF